MKKIWFLVFILSIASLEANECIDKAKVLYNRDQHLESIKLLKQNLNDIIETKDQQLICELYYGLGANYYKVGSLDSSLKYLLISENISNSRNDPKFTTLIYNELSICLNSLGLHHDALFYLKKSLSINTKINNDKGVILNLLNLGNTYYYMNNIDTALTYYSRAKKVIKQKDSPEYINLINSLSVIWARKGNYTVAISMLEDVLRKNSTSLDTMRIYLYKTNLDLYFISNGKPPKNVQLLEGYLQYAKKNNEVKYADANFKASIYKLSTNDFESALRYLNVANSIYVSNHNLFKAREITQYFKNIMVKLKIKGVTKIDNELNDLKEKSIIQYSKALETDIDIRLSIEEKMSSLNKKLGYSIFGIELLVILIILLCVSIPLTIRYIINKRMFFLFNKSIIEYNLDLKETHNNKIKKNIGKMTNIMILSNRFNDDDIFVETIEDLIEGSNELSDYINNFNIGNQLSSSSTRELRRKS